MMDDGTIEALLGRRPGKVIAVHVNYPSRAAERGRTPAQPSYFLKPSTSLSPSGTTVERPAGAELLGFEGEIALVIGTTARRVSVDDAWRHVSGVTAANDLGLYDLREADRGSNLRSKGGDGYTPVGPTRHRRVDSRPDRAPRANVAERRAGAGRHHDRPALPVRTARLRPFAVDHPGTRRPHPHRDSRRRVGCATWGPTRGGGRRSGCGGRAEHAVVSSPRWSPGKSSSRTPAPSRRRTTSSASRRGAAARRRGCRPSSS